MAARGNSRTPARQAEWPVLAGLPESLLETGRSLAEAVAGSDEATNEAALARFLEAGFSHLDSVQASAAFLARLFEGREPWLARRLQTQELIQEMASGQAMLTCVVAGEWVMEKDFVKLARLADGMLAAKQHLRTADCLDVMLAAASSLAVMKNTRAASLLHQVEDCQKNGAAVDAALLREARQRVSAGSVVAAADQTARELWDQRLQPPVRDWSWSSPKELQALRDLAEWLEPGHPAAPQFARVAPAAWWDLWTRQAVTVPAPVIEPPSTPPPQEIKPEPAPAANWAEGLLTRPGGSEIPKQGWDLKQHLMGFLAGSAAGVILTLLAGGGSEADTPAAGADQLPKAVAISPSSNSNAGWLLEERERLAEELEHVGRFGAVKAGGWGENALFLTGRTPELPVQSQMYRKLLVLLHLDPPQDAETRGMVPRLLLRRAADEETVRLWERCVEAGSNMTPEIAAAAREALNQPSLPWTAEQRQRLELLASPAAG